MFPESKVYIHRQINRVQALFNKNLPKKVFVFEITSNGRVLGHWAEITEYETVNVYGNTYDVQNIYYMFGWACLFVFRGVRVPINFSKLEDIFASDKKIAVSSKEAFVKMNNRNAEELIRANKSADIVLYAVIVSAVCGALVLAGLMDLVHLPTFTGLHSDHIEILKKVNESMRYYP